MDSLTAQSAYLGAAIVGHPTGYQNWAYPIYESIPVHAMVSDPDGLGDIAGGYIRTQEGQHRLQTFSGAVGDYHASVSWESVVMYIPVNHPYGANQPVTLEAVFLDQASHEAVYPFVVNMTCQDSAACNSACMDTHNDENNCGACGRQCPGTCLAGACQQVFDVPTRQSCNTFCSAQGLQCSLVSCEYGGAAYSACVTYAGGYCSNLTAGFACASVPTNTKTLDCLGAPTSATYQSQRCYCQN